MGQPAGGQGDRSVVPAVVGAAGAGIGGLGLVAAVGGLVTQARFRGAGLPSEIAVSVESRGYLLAIGGEVLTVAVVIAFALVSAVYWMPPFAPGKAPWKWLLAADGMPRSAWRWYFDARGAPRWRWFFVALAIGVLVDYLIWAGDEAWTLLGVSLGMVGVAIAGSGVATLLAMQARAARDPTRPGVDVMRLVVLFALVTLLGGLAAAAGSLASPRVRPVAVLLRDNPPMILCGIYVGQTSDSLYVGEAFLERDDPGRGDHDRGRLLAVARSSVQRVSIGTAQPLPEALDPVRQLSRVGSLRAPPRSTNRCH